MPALFLLKATCPDGPGIVADSAAALAAGGANILDLSQHTVRERGLFLLRAVVELRGGAGAGELRAAFAPVAEKRGMDWELHDLSRKPRVAILVSKTGHCLHELLLKHQDGHLACEFTGVYSNHPEQRETAAHFGLPFHHVPFKDGQDRHEEALGAALRMGQPELIVLARYMRVLSPAFIAQWRERVINIHHGFLPAFSGAKPYHQAWEKGVKLIGATAHFATEELDQGPILAQGVLPVSDRSSVDELTELGKDVERAVLVEGLKKVLEHRVFVDGGRTFILAGC